MNKQEQWEFIESLVSATLKDMQEALPAVPDNWDGHELRQWIADKFQESSYTLKAQKRRYREYRNTIAVTAGL